MKAIDALLAAFVGEDARAYDGSFVVESNTRWPHVYCNLGVSSKTTRVLIEFIETDGEFRGKRFARTALRDICAWADQHGVILELHPHLASTQAGPTMDDEELIAWYSRHGFVLDEGPFEMMVRIPH